jgi:hypothetical protein
VQGPLREHHSPLAASEVTLEHQNAIHWSTRSPAAGSMDEWMPKPTISMAAGRGLLAVAIWSEVVIVHRTVLSSKQVGA